MKCRILRDVDGKFIPQTKWLWIWSDFSKNGNRYSPTTKFDTEKEAEDFLIEYKNRPKKAVVKYL